MKAVRWYGKEDIRVEPVADPSIVDAGEIILRITSTAICGSDLHLYNGLMPTMEKGDVLGHEPMGEVVRMAEPRRFGFCRLGEYSEHGNRLQTYRSRCRR
jgi:threonine dehydrogenase-like Zn-dependent dehydrogenase